MRTRLTIQTLDLHAGGEPLRLITAGYPPAPHAPILERRRWAREQADHVRRVVCFEPRGHRDMYGAVLLPPYRPDADIAVLFMHNEGYSTMCGHGILALTAGLIEEGLFPATAPETVIRFEAPAGLIVARADGGAGREGSVEVRRRPVHQRSLVPRRARSCPATGRRPARRRRGGTGRPVGRRRVRRRLLRHRRRIRAGLAGGAVGHGGADEGRRRDHRRAPPRPHARLTRSPVTSASSTARSSWTARRPLRPTVSPPTPRCATSRSSPTRRSIDLRAGPAPRRCSPRRWRAGVCGSGTRSRTRRSRGPCSGAASTPSRSSGPHEAIVSSIAGRGYVMGSSTFLVDERDALGGGFLLR